MHNNSQEIISLVFTN